MANVDRQTIRTLLWKLDEIAADLNKLQIRKNDIVQELRYHIANDPDLAAHVMSINYAKLHKAVK